MIIHIHTFRSTYGNCCAATFFFLQCVIIFVQHLSTSCLSCMRFTYLHIYFFLPKCRCLVCVNCFSPVFLFVRPFYLFHVTTISFSKFASVATHINSRRAQQKSSVYKHIHTLLLTAVLTVGLWKKLFSSSFSVLQNKG